MKDRKFVLPILSFVLLFAILHLTLIQHIPNPVISDAILALDLALPIIAGILFGPLVGLVVGLLGPGITCLFSLPLEAFSSDRLLLSCTILPLGIAGLLSGNLARRYSLFISSLPILLVHLLDVFTYYISGLRPAGELFS